MSDGGLVILTFTLGIVVWPAIIAGLCRVLRWSSADQPSRAWAAPSVNVEFKNGQLVLTWPGDACGITPAHHHRQHH